MAKRDIIMRGISMKLIKFAGIYINLEKVNAIYPHSFAELRRNDGHVSPPTWQVRIKSSSYDLEEVFETEEDSNKRLNGILSIARNSL